MQKTIIALAGEMGCGKGTITKYLVAKYGAEVYRFSDVLRDVLDRMHQEKSRANMSNLSTMIRQTFGDDILSEVLLADIQRSPASFIVIDGVRRSSEIESLRKALDFRFVYIDTDPAVRYERITRRGENTDDTTKTFEEFVRDTHAEAETRTRALQDIADVILENNGTIEELEAQYERELK